MSQPTVSITQRRSHRLNAPEGVYVYWSCGGYEDTCKVRNLSVGGLFIETRDKKPVGARAKLNFLVQEGQIRAEATVQHIRPGRGIGLKFVSIREDDCPHLAALLKRLRHP